MNDIQIANLMVKVADAIAAKDSKYGLDEPTEEIDLNDLGKDVPPSKDQRDVAFDTSKSGGFMRKMAITPRVAKQIANPGDKILDFGAGSGIPYTKEYRALGLDVRAYDFGKGWDAGLSPDEVDTDPFHGEYDLVFASSVLNVSSNRSMLEDTLNDIRRAIKPGGHAVFNYPKEPRKWKTSKFPKGVPAKVVKLIITGVFGHYPVLIWGDKESPVWMVGV